MHHARMYYRMVKVGLLSRMPHGHLRPQILRAHANTEVLNKQQHVFCLQEHELIIFLINISHPTLSYQAALFRSYPATSSIILSSHKTKTSCGCDRIVRQDH